MNHTMQYSFPDTRSSLVIQRKFNKTFGILASIHQNITYVFCVTLIINQCYLPLCNENRFFLIHMSCYKASLTQDISYISNALHMHFKFYYKACILCYKINFLYNNAHYVLSNLFGPDIYVMFHSITMTTAGMVTSYPPYKYTFSAF